MRTRGPWQEWQHGVMRTALELARLGKGKTYPNPAVGAVLVKNGEIVGRGFHRRWGRDHAEIEAIKDAGRRSRGADLYVTLEPCCHFGQTPPCTEAVKGSGIRQVLTSTLDPNPLVNGEGIKALVAAGIRVDVGLEAQAATALNEAYFKFMKTGKPFVTLKVAQTLDGKIATSIGNARWITSVASRRRVRALRAEAQAIIVGARTVILDDPTLLPEPRRAGHYYRCVLDTYLSTPPGSALVRSAGEFPLVVFSGKPDRWHAKEFARRRHRLERSGAIVEPVRVARPGMLDLKDVVDTLAAMKTMHIWVEGGSAVFTSFLRGGLVDRMIAFVAPRIMGGGKSLESFGDLRVRVPDDCRDFKIEALECVGGDLMVTVYPLGTRPVGSKPRKGSGTGASPGRRRRV